MLDTLANTLIANLWGAKYYRFYTDVGREKILIMTQDGRDRLK